MALGDIDKLSGIGGTMEFVLTLDGQTTAASLGGNIAYSVADADPRHSGRAIVSFADGHVETNVPIAAGQLGGADRAVLYNTLPPDITSNLVGWWKLDETSGASAADSKGGYTGSLMGYSNPAWVAGKVGNGLRFTRQSGNPYGNAQRVEITNGALDTVLGGDFTMSAWYKPMSLPPNDSNNTCYAIFDKRGYHLGLTLDVTSHFRMTHWFQPGWTNGGASGNDGVTPNNWYHIAGIVDKTNMKIKLYVNGTLVNSSSYTGAAPSYNAGWPFVIGAAYGSGGWCWAADGIIDGVRYYSRALRDQDIAALAGDGVQ